MADQSEGCGARSSVFLVDDDPPMRHSTRMLLESAGLAVCCYATGGQFLEAFSDVSCQCAVVDVRLPDMSGVKLVENLRQRHARVCPLILITGFSDPSLAGAVNRLDVFCLLEKPFDPTVLVDLVFRAIEAGPSAAGQRGGSRPPL